MTINAQETMKINWPETYDPANSKFFVHNEIEINAPPEIVWEILINAEDWPNWYKGTSKVKVNTDNKLIQENSSFHWKTMGIDFESTIEEFVPYRRLSWESKLKKIQGYHAWLIIPTGDGCKVITEEAQNGWLTFFEKLFMPKKLHRLHEIWLNELKLKAEAKAIKS